jgi:serine/threonine protein kinase
MAAVEFLVRDGPEKGRRIALPSDRFSIGSSAGCAIRFGPTLVRELHAEVHRTHSGELELQDLTRANLVWVDGQQAERGLLTPGRVFRLGRLELMVVPLDESGVDATARRPTPFQKSAEASAGHEATAIKATPAFKPPVPDRVEPTQEPTTSGRFNTGDVIDGRYRVVARIAAGGMGEVFRVEHVELGKSLAVKVMLAGLNADQEFVNRFKIEAVAASRIGHPNIIDISDFGRTADGRFYFVMEFLDGMTLSSLVHRQGAQSPRRAGLLGLQAARALAAAHALHIVHRDLKPDNVMVLQRPGNPDLVKVLDFGVARVKVDNESIGKTAAGIVVGTPQYMAPEQAKAMVVDARSDIYSLGLILHELLTGKPTFTGETAPVVMVKQVTEAAAPLPPSVPERFSQLLMQMLEKHPEDRPQTMSEIVEGLEAVLPSLPNDAPGQPGHAQKAATPARAPARANSLPRAPAIDLEQNVQTSFQGPVGEPSEPTPSVSKSKAPLVIIALLAVALIGGGAVLVSGPSQTVEPVEVVEAPPMPEPRAVPPPAPPPAAPTPAARPRLKVKVASEPAGAEVLVEGALVGTTPFVFQGLDGDVVEFHVQRSGYEPSTRKLLISESLTELNLKLTRVAEKVRPAPLPKEPGPREPLKPAPDFGQPAPGIKDNPFSQ